MFRARKVDSNQQQIAKVLRGAGCSVEFLHMVGDGMPDLLCGKAGMTYLLEVKNLAGKGRKLTPDQKTWHEQWRGSPVYVVTSPADALRAVGAI